MKIQNNTGLQNTSRYLKIGTVNRAKSIQKLSSGYKINRAADNASGLAISEKLRKYLSGLMQASSNAQDGISAVQTADGALSNVGDSLQRMNELSIRAANGFMSSSDRKALQAEMDQLVSEVDRISGTTKFNETTLLGGNNGGTPTYDTALSSLSGSLSDQLGSDASRASFRNSGQVGLDITSMGSADGVAGAVNAMMAGMDPSSGLANTTITGASMVSANTGSGGQQTRYLAIDSVDAGNVFKEWSTAGDVASYINKQAASAQPGDALYGVKAFGSMDELRSQLKSDLGSDVNTVSVSGSQLKVQAFADANSQNVRLQVGADATGMNNMGVGLGSMSARSLGINGLRLDGSDPGNALNAIDTISGALSRVNAQRSTLGASQNRLESTVRNLGNVAENTAAADSRIRDTDYGREIIKNSTEKILAQARMSLMTQANQNGSALLRLLQ